MLRKFTDNSTNSSMERKFILQSPHYKRNQTFGGILFGFVCKKYRTVLSNGEFYIGVVIWNYSLLRIGLK